MNSTPTREVLQQARADLRGKADAAYITYIQKMSEPQCLGWEHKIKHGTFGEAELKAHTTAAERLGNHRAYSDVIASIDAYLNEPDATMSEEDAARLDAALVRMRKQRDSLKERLFGALQSDPILKEGLEQVDHAQMIDRMTYSRVLDVACAQKARADEAEAKLAALSEPDAMQAAAQPLDEPHPCEEAARADLLDELEDERIRLRDAGEETTASLFGKAIDWIDGERVEALLAATPPAGERSPEVRAAFDFIEQVAAACPAMTTCQLGSAMAQIMKAAQQGRAVIYSAPDALGNLLARIHGDGGHYRAQHGLEKAIEDAHQLVAVWRANAEERSTPAEPSADQLSKLAYEGFDSYWTEGCAGKEAEAWAACAKAVIKHRDAQWLATPPSPQPKEGEQP